MTTGSPGVSRGNYKQDEKKPIVSKIKDFGSGELRDINQYLVRVRRHKTEGNPEDVPGLLRIAARILDNAIKQLEQPDREQANYYFENSF